jgi:hypothetical protein
MDRVENAECPALQLYLKIIVNLLSSSGSGSVESGKQRKKPFLIILSRLILTLSNVEIDELAYKP